jgi:hypothetical protein
VIVHETTAVALHGAPFPYFAEDPSKSFPLAVVRKHRGFAIAARHDVIDPAVDIDAMAPWHSDWTRSTLNAVADCAKTGATRGRSERHDAVSAAGWQ